MAWADLACRFDSHSAGLPAGRHTEDAGSKLSRNHKCSTATTPQRCLGGITWVFLQTSTRGITNTAIGERCVSLTDVNLLGQSPNALDYKKPGTFDLIRAIRSARARLSAGSRSRAKDRGYDLDFRPITTNSTAMKRG
jgi:hypothetical protein